MIGVTASCAPSCRLICGLLRCHVGFYEKVNWKITQVLRKEIDLRKETVPKQGFGRLVTPAGAVSSVTQLALPDCVQGTGRYPHAHTSNDCTAQSCLTADYLIPSLTPLRRGPITGTPLIGALPTGKTPVCRGQSQIAPLPGYPPTGSPQRGSYSF